jgi:hypothetical protein
MKKTTFLAVALMSAVLISDDLFAQGSKPLTDLVITQPSNASSDGTFAHPAAVSTISLRAIRDFRTRFAKVEDEKWARIEKGFCAFCKKDGFEMRIYYNVRGGWQGNIKYCDETQLPHFIRDVVKRTYYDLAITSVNIIDVPDHTVYLVHLEDKTTLKIVRVTEEGEMDVMEDYVKSN